MLITGVQSEQLRILQAHGQRTTARMSHILDHRAAALGWVAAHGQESETPEEDMQVRQVAVRALTLISNSPALSADE